MVGAPIEAGARRNAVIDEGELAGYFGVAPEIVTFLPALLQDFWELGSEPELVVSWLREEGIGVQSRVLDLGCGKGAVALGLAEAVGCRVDGVDALPAFVTIAQQEAYRRGVEDLCRFEVGDLRETVRHARDYDAVLLVSVGVLGSPAEVVGGCRQCVVPGGLMIFDDSYLLEPGRVEFSGYELLATYEETLRQLTSYGDRLVRERIVPAEEVRAQNRRYTTWIERRADELAARHPEHAAAFRAYVERERQECAILENSVTCAGWMLQRAEADSSRRRSPYRPPSVLH